MTLLLASSRLTTNVIRQSLSFPRRLVSSSLSSSQPLIELTETEIHPSDLKPYLKAAAETAELRESLDLPIRFFSLPDVGGQLCLATRAYYFEGGHAEREAVRAASMKNREMASISRIESTIFSIKTIQSVCRGSLGVGV